MAQSSSYVADLLLKVQADQALTQAKRHLNDLLATAQQAETAFQTMIRSLSKKYGIELDVDLNADNIDAEIERIRRKLNVASSGTFSFAETRQDVAGLAQAWRELDAALDANEVGAQNLIDAQNEAISATTRYQQAAVEASGQAEQGHIKTTLAAQNVVRIVQDLPYGMMGITNNIQSLADSMVYLRNRAKEVGEELSTGGALRLALKDAITGPMAFSLLIAVLTGIILRAEQLGKMFGSLSRSMGLTRREAAKVTADIESAARAMGEAAAEGMTLEQVLTLYPTLGREIDSLNRSLNEQLTNLGGTGSAWNRMAFAMAKADVAVWGTLGLFDNFVAKTKEKIAAAEEDMAAVRGLTALHEEFTKAAERAKGIKLFTEQLRENRKVLDDLIRSMKEASRLQDQIYDAETGVMSAENIRAEGARARAVATAERARIAAEMEAEFDRIIAEKAGDHMTREQAIEEFGVDVSRRLARRYEAELGAVDRQLEETLKGIAKASRGFEFEIRRMQLAALPDSLQKRLREIALDFEETRADILASEESAAQKSRAIRAAEAVRMREETLAYRDEYERLAEATRNLAQSRLAAQRYYSEARAAQIGDEFEQERFRIRENQRLNDLEIQSEIEAARAILNLAETTLEQRRIIQADIAALEAERVALRYETEAALSQSVKAEQEKMDDYRRAQNASARQLLLDELEIAERRRQLSRDADTWNPFTGGNFESTERARMEAVALLEERWRAIQAAFRHVDVGDELFAEKIAQEQDALRRHAETLEVIEAESQERRLEARRRFWQKAMQQAAQMTSALQQALSGFSQAAQMNYDTWRTERERELREMGVTEEERTRILEEEGAKQFEEQKKLQIATAWAQGLAGAVSAVSAAYQLGPAGFVIGPLQAASIMALTAANVRRIKALRPGGGSGSGGSAGVTIAAGAYTALNDVYNADRVAGLETWRMAGGFSMNPYAATADRMDEAVARFERAASNMTAVVEPRGMGQIVAGGINYRDLTNGNA